MFFSTLSSRGLATGSRSWKLSRSDPYHIYWFATVALLPRDDKKCITLTLSCHCERSEAIQSVILSQRDTYFSFNSVFAGANKFDYLDPGVKMHPTKTFVFAGGPRPRMTQKRKPRDDKVEKTRPRMTKKRIARTKTALCTLHSELCTLSPSHGHKEL